MKLISIPEPVTLSNVLTEQVGETVSFRAFVTLGLLTDPRFGSSYEYLNAGRRIAEGLRVANGFMKLDDAAWVLLKDVIQGPAKGSYGGFPPLAMLQLAGFLDAIVEAKEE